MLVSNLLQIHAIEANVTDYWAFLGKRLYNQDKSANEA